MTTTVSLHYSEKIAIGQQEYDGDDGKFTTIDVASTDDKGHETIVQIFCKRGTPVVVGLIEGKTMPTIITGQVVVPQ